MERKVVVNYCTHYQKRQRSTKCPVIDIKRYHTEKSKHCRNSMNDYIIIYTTHVLKTDFFLWFTDVYGSWGRIIECTVQCRCNLSHTRVLLVLHTRARSRVNASAQNILASG